MAKKILIIAPSWVGDCVMAQPLFRRFHELYNDVCLHAFAPRWPMSVLRRMPEVAKVIENPFGHGDIKLRLRYQVGKQLRIEKYDQAILLPASIKSALVPAFAKIPQRTGYLGETRYGLLNDIRPLREKEVPRMVDRYVALAYPPNQPCEKASNPRLIVRQEDQIAVQEKFSLDLSRPVVALCPGAEYGPAKRWPPHHFASLADKFFQQGFNIWLMGSAKETNLTDEICKQTKAPCLNLCGKTNLDEAIDILSLARIAICNDSGLMHVAAALDIPLIAIYGPTSPDYTPPLTDKARVVTLNLQCSPCFERTCPLKHSDCMEKLTCTQVWQAVEDLLEYN